MYFGTSSFLNFSKISSHSCSVNIYMAEKGLNCGINKTVIMVTKITVPDISSKIRRCHEKILPETEKIIKEAESTYN